jgi:hypothetical protein
MATKVFAPSQAHHPLYICAKPAKIVAEAYINSRRYAVTNYDDGIGYVTKGESSFQVSLLEKRCTCRSYQETGLPCQHAVAVCLSQGLDPHHQTARWYHTTAYIGQYAQQLPPIATDALTISNNCMVPCYQRVAGRPRRLVCAAARVQQVAIHANDAVKRVTTAATKAAVVPEQGVYSISSFRTRT